MINSRKLYVLGGGWLSGKGYGSYGSTPFFSFKSEDLRFPPLEKLINELPTRYGRFDTYTKVCFSTAVLALEDANFTDRSKKKNVGVILGSRTGTYENDVAFYKTTIENKGLFSSPNLFSYTLPNIAIGEIAVYFGFTGPTFCVGNDPENPGMEALKCTFSLLDDSMCNYILTGWVEASNKNEVPFGGAFVLLSSEKSAGIKKEFSEVDVAKFSDLFGA